MAKALNNRNSGYISQKKASTDYQVGDCLSVDANGFLVPGSTGKIVGICNEKINAASVSAADYASTRDLNFSGYKHDDEFEFPVIKIITAGAFVVGVSYTILTVGNTDFTLIGAASNTVGVVFVATGAGSGTGTAYTPGTATQTLVGELVDVSTVDARAADVTASTNDQIQVVRIIDSSTIVGRFVVQTA